MVFSSITFLFFFLPAVLALYFCSGKYRNGLLLLASLLFYAWGEGVYLAVMLVSIAMNYVCGRALRPAAGRKEADRRVLIVAVALNLGLLGTFKYAAFFSANLNLVLAAVGLPTVSLAPVHLPIGISFFTFQAVSYLIDIYRGKIEPQKNLISLGLYIALFPQLIAGPIVRYHEIAAALAKRKMSTDDFADGVCRFLYGLSKKVLLANPLALAADKIFALPAPDLTMPLAWLGALCYTLQIYYDFSGYSDMAIGLGRIFGFRFPENFNYPYISRSIREFWRRWHITLSAWFRDYLYIPLGGSRGGRLRTGMNLVTVFLLCGLWHGASWTFVVWGLYHGLFLVLERTGYGRFTQALWTPIRHLWTLVLVVIGWVLFRSDTLAGALGYLGAMFTLPAAEGWQVLTLYVDAKLGLELALAVLFVAPILPALGRLRDSLLARCRQGMPAAAVETTVQSVRLAVLGLLSYFTVISLAAGVYNPFIYYRF